jgi:hypothetical protein
MTPARKSTPLNSGNQFTIRSAEVNDPAAMTVRLAWPHFGLRFE